MTLIERFENKFEKHASGCWLWVAGKYPTGYGMFHLTPKRGVSPTNAHRASWLLYRGPIPQGKQVCHHCDIHACVNPEHLFLGTQKDNIQDMIAKGRKVWSPKLTHCKNGHAFTEQNTGRHANGTQRCRRCASDVVLRYKRRNLEAVRTYQRERARRIREAQRQEQCQ